MNRARQPLQSRAARTAIKVLESEGHSSKVAAWSVDAVYRWGSPGNNPTVVTALARLAAVTATSLGPLSAYARGSGRTAASTEAAVAGRGYREYTDSVSAEGRGAVVSLKPVRAMRGHCGDSHSLGEIASACSFDPSKPLPR